VWPITIASTPGLRDRQHAVLGRLVRGRLALVVLLEPHVADDHDGVAVFHATQDRHEVLRGLERVLELEPRVVRRVVPRRDAGRGQPEDADAHAAATAGARPVRARPGLARFQGVRRQPRELRVLARALEHGQAEVVLVVADRERVVAERVHARHLRVGEAVAFRLALGAADGVQVRERRALDAVAGVDQDRPRVLLLAHALNQRRDAGEPVVVDRLRGLVVPGQEVAVDVGRVEDRDRDPLRGSGGVSGGRRLLRGMLFRGGEAGRGHGEQDRHGQDDDERAAETSRHGLTSGVDGLAERAGRIHNNPCDLRPARDLGSLPGGVNLALRKAGSRIER
jgi:hypothetical protein